MEDYVSAEKAGRGTVHKLLRQPEGDGGSANHQFLPIMPNMFAYEGAGERGVKNSKNHAYVVYGRSLNQNHTLF